MTNDWQPIATAPKDGTQVLLFFPGLKHPFLLGHYVDSEEFEHGKSVRRTQFWLAGMHLALWRGEKPEPSHWMPLPAVPVEPASAEQAEAS